MKKVLLSIAAVATLAAAVPAMAQPMDYGRHRGYENNINQRERDIAFRIERGQRDGSLTWREARRLRIELARIENLEQRYRFGGLNGWERADLNARLDRLSYQVRGERHDRDYGWGNRR